MTDSRIPILLLCVGNENLHLLTVSTRQRLSIDLTDFEGRSLYAEYDDFRIAAFREEYRLQTLGTYRGSAGQ